MHADLSLMGRDQLQDCNINRVCVKLRIRHVHRFKQGETDMGDKGKKDKGKREQQKKAQLNLKEKRKQKNEKKK
ncbi:MAG: hypothetical protein O6852_09990 [Gammaproteobacteria bacterium]|nr:hypothetical protein [Gammaproteobacteria bacterium]